MSELDSIHLGRVCDGDREAWRAFVAAAGPLLRGVVWRVLSKYGHGEDTADVLQDVFVRLVRDEFRLLRQYDPERARLSTWIGVIASSTAVDWLRKSEPAHAQIDEVPEHLLPAAPDEPVSRRLALPADLLSPRQALILKLLYEDDLDVAEVAARLRVEAQTVRSLRHKAIERLRQFLGPPGPGRRG